MSSEEDNDNKKGKITELHTRRSYDADDKMSFAGRNVTLDSLFEAAKEQGIEEGIFIGVGEGGNICVTTNMEQEPLHIVGIIDYSKHLFTAVVHSQNQD